MLLRKGRGEEVAENLIFSVTIATCIFLQQSSGISTERE